MTDKDLANTPVMPLLNAIIALPFDQRLRLLRAWLAIDQDIPDEQKSTDGVDVDAADKKGEVHLWLERTRKLEPKLQIDTLRMAIDQEEEDWILDLLHAEVARVKNSNPWLAAELAVVKYAYEHPVLMTVALFGVGFGVYRLGKAVFAVIF